MPNESLIVRFDSVVADQWEPHEFPTTDSLLAIESRFGCQLPNLLVEFARCSRSFSSFFLSVGPDLHQHSHIIARNEMVRSHPDWLRSGPRAPDNLIFFTDNFMSDSFWCLDVATLQDEPPIVCWEPGRSTKNQIAYRTFEQFVEAQIAFYEAKTRP